MLSKYFTLQLNHSFWLSLVSVKPIYRELVAFLHEKCLESSSFASRASAVFAALGQFEVAGIKFRDVLLRRIQVNISRFLKIGSTI